MVVIVDGNEVSKLQVTSQRSSLAGNTLHRAAISEERVGVVVDQLKAGLVEDGSSVPLSNGETNGIGETLAQRTSCDFNARGVVRLGVARSDAVDLLWEY